MYSGHRAARNQLRMAASCGKDAEKRSERRRRKKTYMQKQILRRRKYFLVCDESMSNCNKICGILSSFQ